MVSYIEFHYYQKSVIDLYNVSQMHEIVSILETSNGRCYTLRPTSEMLRQGIKYVVLGFVSFSKIYIHPPGIYEYRKDSMSLIKNVMENWDFYM